MMSEDQISAQQSRFDIADVAEASFVRANFRKNEIARCQGKKIKLSDAERADMIRNGIQQGIFAQQAAADVSMGDCAINGTRSDRECFGMNDAGKSALRWLNKFESSRVRKLKDAIYHKVAQVAAKFPTLPPEYQKSLAGGIFAAVVVAIAIVLRSEHRGLNSKETRDELINACIPVAIITVVMNSLRPMSTSAVRVVSTAACLELAESTFNVLGGAAVALIGTALFDVAREISSKKDFKSAHFGKKCLEFLKRFGSKLIRNTPAVAACSAASYLCPAMYTLIFCTAGSLMYEHLRNQAEARQQSVVSAALSAAGSVLLFVPRLVVAPFIAPPTEESYEEQIPDALCCDITQEILKDPVYLRAFFVERAVAERQVQDTDGDFHGTPCTLDDIKPVPCLKAITQRYA